MVFKHYLLRYKIWNLFTWIFPVLKLVDWSSGLLVGESPTKSKIWNTYSFDFLCVHSKCLSSTKTPSPPYFLKKIWGWLFFPHVSDTWVGTSTQYNLNKAPDFLSYIILRLIIDVWICNCNILHSISKISLIWFNYFENETEPASLFQLESHHPPA